MQLVEFSKKNPLILKIILNHNEAITVLEPSYYLLEIGEASQEDAKIIVERGGLGRGNRVRELKHFAETGEKFPSH